ncbi:MAG: hypothetical protein U0R19_13090 [Bryobacteraceae bacterium]
MGLPATGDSDFDKHNSVRQGAAFTEMMQQAADALADFELFLKQR